MSRIGKVYSEILYKARFTKKLRSENAVWKKVKIRSDSDLRCQENFYEIWYEHQKIWRISVVRKGGKVLCQEN